MLYVVYTDFWVQWKSEYLHQQWDIVTLESAYTQNCSLEVISSLISKLHPIDMDSFLQLMETSVTKEKINNVVMRLCAPDCSS